jgi:hypothetical protein
MRVEVIREFMHSFFGHSAYVKQAHALLLSVEVSCALNISFEPSVRRFFRSEKFRFNVEHPTLLFIQEYQFCHLRALSHQR